MSEYEEHNKVLGMIARIQKHSLQAILYLAAGLLFVGANSSCSKKSADQNKPRHETINITLKEWRISADKHRVKAGLIIFHLINQGIGEHELIILKTDRPITQLPMKHGKVDEATAGQLIGEIEEFPPGVEVRTTFTLAPGKYVLFCNLQNTGNDGSNSHYRLGMHTLLEVVP